MTTSRQFNFNTALIFLNEAENNKEAECSFWGYGKNSKSFKIKLVRGEKEIVVYKDDKLVKACTTEGQVLDIMIKEAEGVL